MEAATRSPMQPLAAFTAILLLFVHFSNITELAYTLTHVNMRIMYIVAPFAYIAVLFTGGIQNTVSSRWAVSFLMFSAFVGLSVPFSTWIGDSIRVFKDFAMVSVPLILVTTGLLLRWNQIRNAFSLIALAGMLVILNTLYFGEDIGGDRLALSSSGMLGNSNDIASHLVFLIGFFLFVVLDTKRAFIFRIAALGAIGYSLLTILRTGSRGAFLALLVGAAFALWKAPMRIRAALLISGMVAALTLPILLPDSVKTRLGALFGEEHEEAAESEASRSYLFWKSVEFSIHYPIFGVGPGQFINMEGKTSVASGVRGNWHQSHCAWTQISSECGIPALAFLLIALAGSLWGVKRTYDLALRAENREVANTCLAFMVGVVPFLVTITFLSNAYRFYLPTIIGLSIALARAGVAELEKAKENEEPGKALMPPPIDPLARIRRATS